MARGSGETGELVRQHVRKILEQLTARQREKRLNDEPRSPVASTNVAVEVEREEDRSALVRSGERPA